MRMFITNYADINVDDLTEEELRIVFEELLKASTPDDQAGLGFMWRSLFISQQATCDRADIVLDRAMDKIGRKRFEDSMPPDQATHLAERQPST